MRDDISVGRAIGHAVGLLVLVVAPLAWVAQSKAAHAQTPAPTYTEVCGAYVNTGDVGVPVGDGSGADAVLDVPVPVPAGALGICGWKMGAFAQDRAALWNATIFLEVNGESEDHYRATATGQQPPHFLPAGALLPATAPVVIHTRFFNDGTTPTQVRVNAWVWFAMRPGTE